MESKNSAMATTTEEQEGEELELELGLSLGGSSNKRRNDTVSKSDSVSLSLDPNMKCEIHALRRQEAKRKREEKQPKKGCMHTNMLNSQNIYNYNGMCLKAKTSQREVDMEERNCKKSKTDGAGSNHVHTNVNLNLGIDQNDASHNSTALVGPVFPGNGFVYRCANMNVVPCCFTAGEKWNVVQAPVFGYGFVPFQVESDPERNGSPEGGNRKAVSNGSLMCTSSTVSDHRSSSLKGGGSSDTRSRSCSSRLDQPQLNGSKAHDANGQSEHSATSELTESVSAEKMIQSMPTEPKEEAKMQTEPDPADKHISLPKNPTALVESKAANLGMPQSQNHNTSSLPYMPCISTTGNGPNGKTINGFPYRYTKTEVSIVCVCHGSSFSPAEFVQHAGGTDVSHPLRHIRVIPSAF